jgi:hypothetical protein
LICSHSITDTSAATNFLDESLSKIKVKYKLYRKDRSNLTQELDTLPTVSPTVVHPIENIPDCVAPFPSPRESKTKIIPLFAKYSSEKTRLKQWSPKSFKERAGHFKLIVSLLKEIKKDKEIFIENINVKDVRKIK